MWFECSVQALLAAKADVNAKNGKGWTAMKIARIPGHTRMVNFLREAGGKE